MPETDSVACGGAGGYGPGAGVTALPGMTAVAGIRTITDAEFSGGGVGMYAGFLLGGIIGGVLALAKVVDRKRYPFGPFMLVGAVVGVLAGGPFADWYVGR